MKMNQQTYAKLKADFIIMGAAHNIDFNNLFPKDMWNLLNKISHNRAYDDNHPTYKEQPNYRVLPYDGRDYCWYYDGGLNDTHINTVLNKIKKELAPI